MLHAARLAQTVQVVLSQHFGQEAIFPRNFILGCSDRLLPPPVSIQSAAPSPIQCSVQLPSPLQADRSHVPEEQPALPALIHPPPTLAPRGTVRPHTLLGAAAPNTSLITSGGKN